MTKLWNLPIRPERLEMLQKKNYFRCLNRQKHIIVREICNQQQNLQKKLQREKSTMFPHMTFWCIVILKMVFMKKHQIQQIKDLQFLQGILICIGWEQELQLLELKILKKRSKGLMHCLNWRQINLLGIQNKFICI